MDWKTVSSKQKLLMPEQEASVHQGYADPCGFLRWVMASIGMGHESHTRELSNESKNIIFGPKLNEI